MSAEICRSVIFKHSADDVLATTYVGIGTKPPFVGGEVRAVTWRSKEHMEDIRCNRSRDIFVAIRCD